MHQNRNKVISTAFGYTCVLFIVFLLSVLEVYYLLNKFEILNQNRSRVDNIKNITLYSFFEMFIIKNLSRESETSLKTI